MHSQKNTENECVGHSKEYNFDGHESVQYDRKRCRDCIGCDLVSKASLGLRVVAKGGMKTITPYTFDGWGASVKAFLRLTSQCMCSRNDWSAISWLVSKLTFSFKRHEGKEEAEKE